MRQLHLVILSLAAVCFLAACNDPNNSQNDAAKKAEARIASLETQVVALKNNVSDLSSGLALDEKTIAAMQTQLNLVAFSPAYVETDTKNYGIARNQYGTFPVTVLSIEPFLDGYKIHSQIGNLTSTTLTGAKITVQWGFYCTGLKKEFVVASDFLPGRNTNVELTAAPAKPADVKSVCIGIEFSGMKMGLPVDN